MIGVNTNFEVLNCYLPKFLTTKQKITKSKKRKGYIKISTFTPPGDVAVTSAVNCHRAAQSFRAETETTASFFTRRKPLRPAAGASEKSLCLNFQRRSWRGVWGQLTLLSGDSYIIWRATAPEETAFPVFRRWRFGPSVR